MTATQCAAKLDMSIAAWSQWENAKRDPSLEDLPKICDMFAVSFNELFGFHDGISMREIKAVGGSAVAIGNHTTAKVVTTAIADCKTCPYKKWGEKLRKQGLVIPGA